MRARLLLLIAVAVGVLAVVAATWLLLRPVDPAGRGVPAPITVPERTSAPSAPGTVDPLPPPPVPTDVVPPPPLDDDDDDDPDDDDPDDDDD
ncbi:hypothetical protein [Blastococcus sp. CCUG 61487]|uniref:hypothetical protein n=1 Tax=Blastococcus sp. CCUG 61487 TaxID=1840703 RepID=UPI0010BF74C6|nr:hypothetical protein [Blastococcus sp. CCUG 61487]